MAELTDLEKAYLVGFRDGYRCAMEETQRKADRLADQLKADFCPELQAIRAELDAVACAPCGRSIAP